MKYHDVVIEAFEFHSERRPDKTRPARFKVRVLTSPAGELSQASAASVSYDTRDVDQQLQRLERRLLDVPGLIQFGRALSMLLFPPSGPAGGKGVRELFAESLAAIGIDDRVRLRLVLPPELAALPWEYVYLDRSDSADSVLGFLALDPRVAIVRHELLPLPKPTPALKGDVKVLVALASGEGLPALDLDAEERGVHKALDGLPGIAWNIVRDATLDEVQQGMAGVGVFHFAGHGGFYLQPGTVPGTVVGKGELAFDDARVDAEQLAINLRGNGVRLAVLAGCETARRDGVAVWSGIAPLLVRGEIPAVVGNQFSIQDHCAIAFSQHFYRALAGGLPLEHAVTAGRIAAYNADQAGRDWGAPVLYLRAADGLLFDGAALEVVREEARHAAQIDVTARAKEVAAGGKIIGAVVKEMLEGKLAVRVEVDGAVYGTVIGLTLGRLDAGDISVKTEASTVGKGGSLTGVTVDTLGRRDGS